MADLTISQGLRQVKKLKGQLAELQTRASGSVTYQASSKPAFDFAATVAKAESVRTELVLLESRIARTNASATVSLDGSSVPLVRAVKSLAELKGLIAWYRTLPTRAQADTVQDDWDYDGDKRMKVQTPWKCDLPSADCAAKVEELQSKFDALNDEVERTNHSTVLPA